jgi:hypothetical protein
MKQLIEDYQRRLATVNEMINNLKFKDDANPDYIRLTTKRAEYRTVITELERGLKNEKEKVFDAILEFAPKASAEKVQKYITEKFA